MKKYLIILGCLFFVFGFAASAYSMHAVQETTGIVTKGTTKVTLGGVLRFRGEYKDNVVDQLDGTSDDHTSAYDGRLRLNADISISKNVKGYFELEATDGDNYSDNYTWGNYQNGPQAGGIYNEGDTKQGDLKIRQAWVLYTKGKYGIKIGHMLLALGESRLFFDHTTYGDDAIVVFANPNKRLHLSALTIKMNERDSRLNDDANTHVALFVYNGDKYKLSGDVTYVDDQRSYASTATDPARLGTYWGNVHLWNIGLRGSTSFGPLSLRGDVEVQTGEFDDTDVDIEGFAVMAGADYRIGPSTLTLEFGYGSGDDDAGDDDWELFITALSSENQKPGYTYVYDYRVKTAAGSTNTGIANTTYVKAGAKTAFSKAVSGQAYLYWLQASEDVSLNGGKIDDEIGWELDAKVTYKFAKNLKYWVEGGVLFTGDAYDYATEDADDAYAVRHGIQLDF